MRPLLYLLAIGALAISQVRAQVTLNDTAALELPECVRECGMKILPQMNCTIGDACYCARTGPVADSVADCVMASCPSLRDALEGLKFQANTCDWPKNRDLAPFALALTIALLVVTTSFLLARLASRWPRFSGAGFSWDDGVAVMCYLPILAMAVVGYHMVMYGLGKDVWMVPIPDVLQWSKWFFAVQSLYIFTAYCTKLSLILLYLRTWPVDSCSNRTFRFLCKAIGVLLCVTAVVSVLTIIFACNPMSNAWRYANRAGGTCIDRVGAAYAFGGINVIFDLVVIILPIPKLLKLRVSTRQKIGLISCFLVGFAVTACSIIRLTHLGALTNARNATWDFFPLCMWSIVEVYCSMMCCCMPAMAGLLMRCFHCVAEKTTPRAARIPSFDMVLPEKSNKEIRYSEEYAGIAPMPQIHPRELA